MEHWRPKDWENPYDITDTWNVKRTTVDQHKAYEAGADAMQQEMLALIENPNLVPQKVAEDIKLYMGLIPGENE